MKSILIVEDEPNISDFIKGELEYEGYNVSIKEDGRKGLEEALRNEYDLVILDVMLPSMNGFEICRRLKREKQSPVIMLSAKDSVMDKVNGLQIGADDYIAKPFAIEELLARIEVVFRRQDNLNNYIVKFKDIVINKSSRIVKRNGIEISLTNKEYELLTILIDNKDKVVTREELLEKIWGYGYEPETNVTDVYIRYLRSKLNNENKEEYIQTIRSIGYIMRS
ncbi:MAG: response regulator transcription factor [Clostridium celatum]|uniref:response regulator transcription factor n=1 Tax=Clostridium sp. TaxID=1506 RepID=UPI0025B927BB|nr:response regulator transcription factor [Clostridium sp.]MBS4958777.1 response regulator transcription factor [Clostridium sp.]MDU4883678.1 response regulator transcription factor [Clostridium celatum]MDU5260883.1 response regulator transcription factor [Clostridium celatum]MDU7076571.1 response regulator transcription factor [Clostridium celatum]